MSFSEKGILSLVTCISEKRKFWKCCFWGPQIKKFLFLVPLFICFFRPFSCKMGELSTFSGGRWCHVTFRTRYGFAHSSPFHLRTENPLLSLSLLSFLLLNTNCHFQSLPLKSRCVYLSSSTSNGEVYDHVWHLTQCQRHSSKQILRSSILTCGWSHLKTSTLKHSGVLSASLSQILNKAEKSFQGADFWKPGGLHICKSGLRTPFAIKNLLASFLVRAASHPQPCPSLFLLSTEVCSKSIRHLVGTESSLLSTTIQIRSSESQGLGLKHSWAPILPGWMIRISCSGHITHMFSNPSNDELAHLPLHDTPS